MGLLSWYPLIAWGQASATRVRIGQMILTWICSDLTMMRGHQDSSSNNSHQGHVPHHSFIVNRKETGTDLTSRDAQSVAPIHVSTFVILPLALTRSNITLCCLCKKKWCAIDQGFVLILWPSFQGWDFHYKIRRSWDRLIFIMGIPIYIYIETTPRPPSPYLAFVISTSKWHQMSPCC